MLNTSNALRAALTENDEFFASQRKIASDQIENLINEAAASGKFGSKPSEALANLVLRLSRIIAEAITRAEIESLTTLGNILTAANLDVDSEIARKRNL